MKIGFRTPEPWPMLDVYGQCRLKWLRKTLGFSRGSELQYANRGKCSYDGLNFFWRTYSFSWDDSSFEMEWRLQYPEVFQNNQILCVEFQERVGAISGLNILGITNDY